MLRRWLRECSPLAVGYVAGMAGTGTLSAYDFCVDGKLDMLPTFGGCHCWIAGAGGLILGLICAALVPLVRALFEPLLAQICDAFTRLAPRGSAPIRFLVFAKVEYRRLDPLARRHAGRR